MMSTPNSVSGGGHLIYEGAFGVALPEELKVQVLGRGFAWLDTGTHDSLMEASMIIETIEKRQGLKVACIEEIAYRMGYINSDQLITLAEPLNKRNYATYLFDLVKEDNLTDGMA